MKPDWDRLGDEYADSDTVVIGDVDCTVHIEFCQKFGVSGYPTIKYFTASTPADGELYEGGRDFNSLKAFADESLGPSCSNENLELCDAAQKATLEKYNAMTSKERKALITEADGKVAELEAQFKRDTEALQATYERMMKEKDELIKSKNTAELRLLKSIKA